MGKTDADLRAAVRAAADGDPLRWVAVESAEELEALSRYAGRAGLGTLRGAALEVLLRLNPDVTPETHAGLAVGRGTSKFGMTETELTAAVAGVELGGALRVRGIHLHVGSQLGAVDAWRDAVRRGLALLALIGAGRPGFDTFDVGGGFPVGDPGSVPHARPLRARGSRPARRAPPGPPAGAARRGARPLPRCGRRLAGRPGPARAGARGQRADRRPRRRHDRARPPGAVRREPPDRGVDVARPAAGRGRADAARSAVAPTAARIDGPICESTDTFGAYPLPPVRRGDLVAIGEAGAYAASMAMTYNGRPVPAQVLLEADGSLTLGRRRRAASR